MTDSTSDAFTPVRVRTVDINADLGESYGVYRYGHDREIMPLITSANIACGTHAGDPTTMRQSVAAAIEHGVAIGAHVGLPDRLGFGRREIAISPDDAYDYTIHQIGGLDAFARAAGAELTHVKPHGALYMMAARDPEIANSIARAVRDLRADLEIFTLPGCALHEAADAHGIRVRREFFADRPYRDGIVTMFGWSTEDIGGITGVSDRVRQAVSSRGSEYDTICVHSDTPNAPHLLAAVHRTLRETLHMEPSSARVGDNLEPRK